MQPGRFPETDLVISVPNSFGKEFTTAVEQKQIAQQDAERAKFVVEKVRLCPSPFLLFLLASVPILTDTRGRLSFDTSDLLVINTGRARASSRRHPGRG